MLYSTKCPKCGLMQLPRESCKSCGTILNIEEQYPIPKRVPPRTQGISPSLVQEPSIRAKPPQIKDEPNQSHQLTFHGTGGELFGIQMVNMLLTIVTLGFYFFWGKVKVRRYIFGQTEFKGDRFGYHGTGKEFLIGFLKAFLFFFLPLILLDVLPDLMGAGQVMKGIARILTYLILIVFIPVAMVGARRYRLSRTSWRGIRFSFRGETWEFLKLFIWGSFLTAITLGFYNPIFETRRYGFMVSHSYFGNQKFNFNGNGRELLGPYLRALLLMLPTLGLYWFWFLARKQRFFWEHTSFGSIRFRSTITGGPLLRFSLGNLALLIVTLGLAWSWIAVRSVNFALKYVTLQGPLDLENIRQEAQTATATGEALSGLMDSEFDFA